MTRPVSSISIARAIGAELRDDIWDGKFRCLDAFLFELSSRSCATEVGIFRICPDRGVLPHSRKVAKEWGGAVKLSEETFMDLGGKLILRINEARETDTDDEHQFSQLIACKDIDSIDLKQHSGWIILRRFWPDRRWRRRGEEKHEFWIYLVSPSFFMVSAERFEADDRKALVHIGNLSASFIRWKTEQLLQKEDFVHHALQVSGGDETALIKKLTQQVVWPVRPEVMLDDLDTVLECGSLQHSDRIQALYKIGEDVKGCSEGRCRGYPGIKADQIPCFWDSECLSDDQRRTDILPGLYYWKVRFWETETGVGNAHKETAFKAMEKAGHFLVDSWQKEAVFGSGGGRNLLRWFVGTAIIELLEHREHRRAVDEFRAGSQALLLAERLAALAAVLIGEGRWKPDAIALIPNVFGLYGHVMLDVPDQLELVRHLRQTLQGEAALHTLKARYRDHFFHTIEVCLIGFALLKSRRKKDGQRFVDEIHNWCPEEHRLSDADRLLTQWWVASLIHDTAYSIDALGSTLDLLGFFRDDTSVADFIGKVRGAAQDLSQSQVGIKSDVFKGLLGDATLGKGDHGLIAASHVYALLAKSGTGVEDDYRSAIRASAFHNTKYPQVDAGEDPVAALLILCDTIQDWGRSQHGFREKPEIILSRIIGEATTRAAEQFGGVETFSFSLKMEGGMLLWENAERLTVRLRFRDLVIENLGVFFKWADVSAGLQRVDFSAWRGNGEAPDFELVYETPFAVRGVGYGEVRSLFKMLCRFDRDVVGRSFSRFIAIAQQEKEEAIRWEDLREEIGGCGRHFDRVTFNLKKLGQDFKSGHPAFSGALGDFPRRLADWKELGAARAACRAVR